MTATSRTARLSRRSTILIALGVLLLGIAGLFAYAYFHYIKVQRYTVEGNHLTVQTERISGLGTVLVTNKGYPLYMFPPDKATRGTCTGHCAFAWPPLVLPDDADVVAGPGVSTGLLNTVRAPDGKRVVTYHGWPLYTYLGDAEPGHATGQGVDDDGGYWYTIRPSGQIVNE